MVGARSGAFSEGVVVVSVASVVAGGGGAVTEGDDVEDGFAEAVKARCVAALVVG